MRALRRLRLRFALLSTLLTGVVLLAACLLGYRLSSQQLETAFHDIAGGRLDTLTALLHGGRTINEVQIFQYEAETGVTVVFVDGGRLVHLNSPHEPTLREALLARAMASTGAANPTGAASETYLFSLPDGPDITGAVAGDTYFMQYECLDTETGGYYGVIAIHPVAPLQRQLSQARLTYSLIFLGALLGLAAAGFLIAHLAVRPARRAAQHQADFIAAAGHELKSPLAVVQTSAEMIEKDGGNREEYVQNILAEASRMNRLVGDLLLLAGGDAGRITVQPRPFATDTMLISVYDRFLPLAGKAGFALTLDLPDTALPTAFADEERAVQVLAILLSNAFEYSTPGTGVEITATPRRRAVLIRVADHGPGVPPQDQKRIFSRFYRADKSRTEKEHFGLGLPVAKELATLNGGSLWHSPTPGGGATFSFTLPTG